MNEGYESIIVEYPFRKTWENPFSSLAEIYEYKITTIHCIPIDIKNAYEGMEKRSVLDYRHPGHSAKQYSKEQGPHISEVGIDFNIYLDEFYNNEYTSIYLGTIEKYYLPSYTHTLTIEELHSLRQKENLQDIIKANINYFTRYLLEYDIMIKNIKDNNIYQDIINIIKDTLKNKNIQL